MTIALPARRSAAPHASAFPVEDGLAENGGGVIGFDEAVCVVTILERG